MYVLWFVCSLVGLLRVLSADVVCTSALDLFILDSEDDIVTDCNLDDDFEAWMDYIVVKFK